MRIDKQYLAALVIGAALASSPASTLASEGGHGALPKANNDVSNTASLQRGARNFVNYCYGCHSLQYVRLNRVGADLGLSEQQVIDNLLFAGERPSELMKNAMPAKDAERWFGRKPPDLSLIARSKGPDYVYNFLKSFYLDPTRPTGTNNTVLPNASMPHVLWELQGVQKAVMEGSAPDHEGNVPKHFTGFELVAKGKLDVEQYDEFVRDTVNFLDYVGEPFQLKRQSLGIGVMFFLLLFFGFAYFLKQEYWKDVK
jgi:ubiquinol-cytochrome c reductase cytochrome c1 subunit